MPFVVKEGTKKKYSKRIALKKLQVIYLAVMNIPNEIGGSIDFDRKGKFLRLQIFPNGARDELQLHDNHVVEWHTHPDKDHICFPSPTDLVAQAKRSINSNSKRITRYKKFRGPLAVVFSRWGAITYSYKKCKIPTRKEQKEILDFMMKIANRTKKDNYQTMRLMAQYVRTFGFRICLQSWQEIRKGGLRLEWEGRRFHATAK